MSPKKRGFDADKQAAPAEVVDGPNTTEDYHLDEKSAAPLEAIDMMLASV